MLTPGDRVGVAVSGGADSVTLLHVLNRLRERFQIGLMVLHVNHELRATESDEDEQFVRELAALLGFEIAVAKGPVEGGNLEQQARDVRREFFHRMMREHGLAKVALGHTRSDQAETVLFRLLRGSGLAGLAGMMPVSGDGFIRPLLTTSREEVREWARHEGIRWREDSSNMDSRFARNRLRNEAIPALAREFNPNLERILAGTAELAQVEEDYWIQEIEPLYLKIAKRNQLGSFFQIGDLAALHPAVQRRLLRRAIVEVKGNLRSIGFEHIEAILGVCRSKAGHDRAIVPGVDALRSFEQLLLSRPGTLNSMPREYRVELEIGCESELPFGEGVLSVYWAKRELENCVTVKKGRGIIQEIAELDPGIVANIAKPGLLYARNWEPGDQLQRPGRSRPEKIKTLFQEQRILLWERRHWPVVVLGGEIVWTRRFGSAAKFTATSADGRVLRLTYQPNPE